MNDDTRLSILAELDKYDLCAGDLQPDEFTQKQFVEYRASNGESWSEDRARRHLTHLVTQGYLTRRVVVHDGARCYAYRKVQ